jgi:RNA polymerase sigma-70 factor, ECF subfamily
VSAAAEQALNDVLNNLQKCGSKRRFTTWARKLAVVEASVRLRRREWQSRTLPSEEECWGPASNDPDQQDLLLLRRITQDVLADMERRVLTALMLGHVPIDVIADRLGTSRGEVDQLVRGARAKLHASLVVSERASGPQRVTDTTDQRRQ